MLLHQGLSLVQLSITISIGITLGLFPVFGLTSLLCFLFSLKFRLNILVIQIANWLVSPLQLFLIIPFMKFGKWIYYSLGFENDYIITNGYLHGLITTHAFAIIGWAALSIPFTAICYLVTLHIYKKYSHIHKYTRRQTK